MSIWCIFYQMPYILCAWLPGNFWYKTSFLFVDYFLGGGEQKYSLRVTICKTSANLNFFVIEPVIKQHYYTIIGPTQYP